MVVPLWPAFLSLPAFKISSHPSRSRLENRDVKCRDDATVHCSAKLSISRRQCLRTLALVGTAGITVPNLVMAAMYSSDTAPSFSMSGDPKKLSSYMPQIEAGYATLLSLRDNWVAKTEAYDGDVVRRDLGTVGVTSPLFNIRKHFVSAWKIVALTSPDEEKIERLESEWNDVVDGIAGVDYQLYSVSFTELRETKESLIRQGRDTLEKTISIYKSMLDDFKSFL